MSKKKIKITKKQVINYIKENGLVGAFLEYTDFKGVQFFGVDLSYGDLYRADLNNACLKDANLSGIILRKQQAKDLIKDLTIRLNNGEFK